MNVKFLFNFKTRHFFLFFGIFVFFILLLTLGTYFVSEQVNQHREQIMTKIKEELGFPITFDNIKTRWFGLSLGISVHNVTVFDPEVPVAFIKMDTIKFYPDLSAALFERELKFKKLVLKGFKLVVGWDKKGFSILGLGGEPISSTVDYSKLMALLSKQPSILIKDADINSQGLDLQIKPWIKGDFHWAKDHPEGKIAFKKVDFQYTSGWPVIEKASGFIDFKDDKVIVQLSKGDIMDSAIEAASAIIEPIGKIESPIVRVEGVIKSTLEAGVLFLQKSPLQKNIGSYLEKLDPSGEMDLSLYLTIPLEQKSPIKLQGRILAKEGEIKIPETDLFLKQLTGDFHFTEQGIQDSEGSAYLKGEPLNLTIKTTPVFKHQILEIAAKGSFNARFFQQTFQHPLLDRLQGESLFTILFRGSLNDLKGSSVTEWVVTSDLQGMEVQLPDFLLGKTANQPRFMTVKLGLEQREKQKIALHIENLLDAKLIVSNLEGEYQLKNGHIVFGSGIADWGSKEALRVTGEIKNLNVNDWVDFFDSLKLPSHYRQDLPALNIQVLADRLEIYSLSFDKVLVTSNFASTPLMWSVDGPFVKGFVSLPVENSESIDMKFDFEHLRIMKNNISEKTETHYLIEKTNYPISFRCKHFTYENSHLGEVSFKLSPASYGYAIENLLFETKTSELSGKGEWHLGKNRAYTILQGKLTGTNMGEIFSRWGYPTAIRESSGYIQYDFKWPKHPFQFDLSILEGNAELKFDKGRIIGVNPGLGRILGLLNIASIQRRLRFDFSDVLKRGFVFDKLGGKFNFQNGMTSTNELLIDGPSAKITLGGDANLKTKNVDLRMTVTPHVGVGLPLVAAIAAGPAVGAGVWFLDKMTGSRISGITRHVYQVSGTWDAPRIQELNTK